MGFRIRLLKQKIIIRMRLSGEGKTEATEGGKRWGEGRQGWEVTVRLGLPSRESGRADGWGWAEEPPPSAGLQQRSAFCGWHSPGKLCTVLLISPFQLLLPWKVNRKEPNTAAPSVVWEGKGWGRVKRQELKEHKRDQLQKKKDRSK